VSNSLSDLGDLNPKFWYKDEQGNILKYIYCKLCHAGPFKESENRENFIFFGLGKKDPYCASCSSAHHHFQSYAPKSKKDCVVEEELPLKNPFKEDDPLDMVELD
jgi:hypothetical protein